MDNLIVKKSFGNLVEGDEICITHDIDSRIYFSVINRTRLVRFYGNEKGAWGKGNPCPAKRPTDHTPFMLVEEKVSPFTAIVFDKLPFAPPHPTNPYRYADGTEDWFNQCLNKIINDFKAIGVL